MAKDTDCKTTPVVKESQKFTSLSIYGMKVKTQSLAMKRATPRCSIPSMHPVWDPVVIFHHILQSMQVVVKHFAVLQNILPQNIVTLTKQQSHYLLRNTKKVIYFTFKKKFQDIVIALSFYAILKIFLQNINYMQVLMYSQKYYHSHMIRVEVTVKQLWHTDNVVKRTNHPVGKCFSGSDPRMTDWN